MYKYYLNQFNIPGDIPVSRTIHLHLENNSGRFDLNIDSSGIIRTHNTYSELKSPILDLAGEVVDLKLFPS